MKKILVAILVTTMSFCFFGCARHIEKLDATAELGPATFMYPSSWEVESSTDSEFRVVSSDGTKSATLKIYDDMEYGETAVQTIASSLDSNHSTLEDCQVGDCPGEVCSIMIDVSGVSYLGRCLVVDAGGKCVSLVAVCEGGKVLEESTKIIESFGCEYHRHVISDWVTDKEPTCSEMGERHGTCTECGKTMKGYILKTEHTPGEWVVQRNVSVTSNGTVVPGEKVQKCAVCGASMATEAITMDLTMGQKNALKKAYSYLGYTSFSHESLIEQLEYEGFSNEDSTFAVDHCGADWNEQAAKKAKSYLSYTSFSRAGLIEQLEFEGFTSEQAEYGVSAVGY